MSDLSPAMKSELAELKRARGGDGQTEIPATLPKPAPESQPLLLPRAKLAERSPLVKTFPKDIAEADAVHFQVEPDRPTFRLIHIASNHLLQDKETVRTSIRALMKREGREMTAELEAQFDTAFAESSREFERVESRVRKLTSDLQKRFSLREVYSEGIHIESFDSEWNPIGEMKSLHGISAKVAELDNTEKRLIAGRAQLPKSQFDELKTAIELYRRQLVEITDDPKNGAAIQLLINGTVQELRPTETDSLQAASHRALLEGNLKSAAILDDREDGAVLFTYLQEQTRDGVAVMLFGAAHDFKNNVEAWNRRHPDTPMALTRIEIHSSAKTSKPPKPAR